MLHLSNTFYFIVDKLDPGVVKAEQLNLYLNRNLTMFTRQIIESKQFYHLLIFVIYKRTNHSPFWKQLNFNWKSKGR